MGHQADKKLIAVESVAEKGVRDPLETPLSFEHNRSLGSSLGPYIKRTAPTERVLRDAREAARAAAALERMGGQTLDVSSKTEK